MLGVILFSLILVVLGAQALIKGRIRFGSELGDDPDGRGYWIEGAPARWVGAGIVLSGLAMIASPAVGACLLFAVFMLVCFKYG